MGDNSLDEYRQTRTQDNKTKDCFNLV